MKKTLLAATLLAVSTTTLADTSCLKLANSTAIVMLKRQEGEPIQQQIGAIDNPLFREMVEEAYDYPKYETWDEKTEAILEFEGKWYIKCMEAKRK